MSRDSMSRRRHGSSSRAKVIELVDRDGTVTNIKVTDELVYRLRVRVLNERTVAIVDGFASEIMPGVLAEHIREVLMEDKRRGEKGGGTEPTGTRKTMRECMSRAQSLLWDGKL